METVPHASARLWHGTASHERVEERRRRLLDAGLDLYGTVGYRSVTVQAICQLARVSTRSFYQLFSGQEELLEQLYTQINEEILGALTTVPIPRGADVYGSIRGIVAEALGPILRDDRKTQVIEVEAVGVSDSLEERRRETMRRLAAAVDDAFDAVTAAHQLPPLAKGLTSLVVVGGVTEALVQRVQTPPQERLRDEEFLDEVARVALRLVT